MGTGRETAGKVFGDQEGQVQRRKVGDELDMRHGLIKRLDRESMSVDHERFAEVIRDGEEPDAVREEIKMTLRRGEIEPVLVALRMKMEFGSASFFDLITEVNAFALAYFTTAERQALVDNGIDLSNPTEIAAKIEQANPTPAGFGGHRGGGYPNSPTPSEQMKHVFTSNLKQLLIHSVGGHKPSKVYFAEILAVLKRNLG